MTTDQSALRSDARRNVERLKGAAIAAFEEGGLATPLEEIARRAGVSVGTIYNRFGSREALIDAVVPEVAAAKLGAVGAAAEAETDPWARFARYLEGLYALQAEDPALSDVIANAYPNGAHELAAVCSSSIERAAQLMAAAQGAGTLRADFTVDDLTALLISNAALVHSGDSSPDSWGRILRYVLDGLRVQNAE